MPVLEIALLGPPDIKINGKPVKTDRRKAIALLAYLAVTGKSHTRDQLAALLWPDYEKDSAYAYLRRTLWELNKILGKGWIESDRERAALVLGSDLWLDTATFQKLNGAVSNGASVLTEAVDLYRGEFLDGFYVADTQPFEDWQRQQAEYFRREFADALMELVDACTQVGKYESALMHARRWLALDLLNESAHRAIMILLAKTGDRIGAIRQYETCADALKAELGIEPQRETTELYEGILRGEISGRQPHSGVMVTESPSVSRLPVTPTPFIGRLTEVEQVKTVILKPTHRLITLTGPGGTGKTRLSIQVASEVKEAFPDGVFFASLVSVQSPDALIPAIAKAIDFSFYKEEDRRQQLLDYLHEKRLLLILDNFEHLLEASDQVSEFIRNSAQMKLVVTSRVRLNLQGEQLYPVGGMSYPDLTEVATWECPEEQAKDFSALQLFLERARFMQPDFALTKVNVTSVVEICRLVQGIPLGLELAAAWVELLPVDEIAAEITRNLDFLETDQVDVPDRQRSLRAVFETSWKFLSRVEQDAFLSLCVFVGSFSREAAEQVSGASVRTLLRLANKSWLQQTGDGRLQLHELNRQYGEERLKVDKSAWREAKNRHADYFSSFVAEQSNRMQSPEQLTGFSAVKDEFDTNIKAAWDYLVSERCWNTLIENMLPGLFQFGEISWQTDAILPWFRSARVSLASGSAIEERTAKAIFSTLELYCEEDANIKEADTIERLGLIWQMVCQHDLTIKMGFWYVLLVSLVRASNLAPDVDEQLEGNIARLRNHQSKWQLGMSLLFQAHRMSEHIYDSASILEAAKIFEELGVIYEQGLVAEYMGYSAYRQRRPFNEVTNYYDKARQFYKKLKGYSPRIGINLLGLANIYFRQGECEQGFALYDQQKRELERMGQMRAVENNEHWECLFAARYSTFEHALNLRQHDLELVRNLGSQSDLAWRLFELGDVYRIFGKPEKAWGLFEQARPMFEKLNMALGLGYDQRARGDLVLENKQYSAALVHYQKYDAYVREANQVWGMTQSQGKIALAHAYLGNIDQARLNLGNALAKAYEYREDDVALQALLAEAVCLLQEGNLEGTIKLVSFLRHHPGSWNETRQHALGILETASHNLDQDVVRETLERGKTLDFDSIIAELKKSKWFLHPQFQLFL